MGSVQNGDDFSTGPEPLVIVGVGLRLPGDIHTLEDLWTLLADKKSTRCKTPSNRFNVGAFYNEHGGGSTLRNEYGHYLAESTNFKHLDLSMFSVGKKEANILDPQEKLLLEVVYECMQNAGQANWRGKNIGCFVGTFGEVGLILRSLFLDISYLSVDNFRTGPICTRKILKLVDFLDRIEYVGNTTLLYLTE